MLFKDLHLINFDADINVKWFSSDRIPVPYRNLQEGGRKRFSWDVYHYSGLGNISFQKYIYGLLPLFFGTVFTAPLTNMDTFWRQRRNKTKNRFAIQTGCKHQYKRGGGGEEKI
jgi:hypothetical protein